MTFYVVLGAGILVALLLLLVLFAVCRLAAREDREADAALFDALRRREGHAAHRHAGQADTRKMQRMVRQQIQTTRKREECKGK